MFCLQLVVAAIIILVVAVVQGVCIIPWFGLFSDRGLVYTCEFGIWVVLLVYSYLKCCLTPPGAVPAHYNPPEVANVAMTGVEPPGLRFCAKCDNYKPPRTHHCSMCKRCVLRMDHHCPWINNCIGFYNYKYFILFLFYTVIAVIHALGWLLARGLFSPVRMSPHEGGAIWLALTVLLPVCIMVSCLLSYHVTLIWSNETTLEQQMAAVESMRATRWRGGTGRARVRANPHPFRQTLQQIQVKPAQSHTPTPTPTPTGTTSQEPQPEQDQDLDSDDELTQSGPSQWTLPGQYDLGAVRNIRAIMGPTCWSWLLPVAVPGDGLTFPMNPAHQVSQQDEGSELELVSVQ